MDGCGQQLQCLSLLDEERRRLSQLDNDRQRLQLEEEKQRVAALRRLQIESEQFRYFEDQLRHQELANKKGEEAGLKVIKFCKHVLGLFSGPEVDSWVWFFLQVETKVPEVIDGSCLSQQSIRGGVQLQGADLNRKRPPAAISQSAASLAGVHSEYTQTQTNLMAFLNCKARPQSAWPFTTPALVVLA